MPERLSYMSRQNAKALSRKFELAWRTMTFPAEANKRNEVIVALRLLKDKAVEMALAEGVDRVESDSGILESIFLGLYHHGFVRPPRKPYDKRAC